MVQIVYFVIRLNFMIENNCTIATNLSQIIFYEKKLLPQNTIF